jgi:hypothetical protein
VDRSGDERKRKRRRKRQAKAALARGLVCVHHAITCTAPEAVLYIIAPDERIS